MRRLTALVTAAGLIAFGWTASAPGQLDDAARTPLSAAAPLPVPGTLAAVPKVKNEREVDLGAEVLRRTALRESPDGKIVTGIGPRTRFGGTQVLAVVARRGKWVGVLHQWMPNGKAGWVDEEDLKLMTVAWSIEVDRSRHLARVRHQGKVVRRFSVAVGRPDHPTPVGRFAVTDRLVAAPGSPYGCCILAMSGRQPKLPAGWGGGDRLALHGSPSDIASGAVSTGCVRVRERDLRWMMRRIPVGTRVTVKP